MVMGGAIQKGDKANYNSICWKLGSETQFISITDIPDDLLRGGPAICHCDWNKLILAGGLGTDVCVMFDMSTKKWKKMKNLKDPRLGHVSVSILKQLFIFGGDKSMRRPAEWSTSVEYLNIEQEHGVWHAAPPIPSAVVNPRITNLDTNVYLIGDDNPVLYLFDVIKKVWNQKIVMPQNSGYGFSIVAGNDSIYAAGGDMRICWEYSISTDSWAKLSSPALMHVCGALIFHQNSLLLLGGGTEHIEGYATEKDIWVMAPYKLPKKLFCHYAFMMDLGE